MRLLPRSLFGRIVLVLLAGLATAQIVSLAIHLRERGQLLAQASGMRAAQRIADIVRLLDPLNPAERRRIVNVLSAPPLIVALDREPLTPREEDAEKKARAALFGTMLRRFLGEEWPVMVTVTSSPPLEPFPMHGMKGEHGRSRRFAMEEAMPRGFHPGLSFIAQVRLNDGTLVTFDARTGAETASWPYRLLLSMGVLLASVIVVSLIAVRWATRPLKALADAADDLGKNIDRPPLPENGPVEVSRAARAFNVMQQRIQQLIRDRTRLFAAMSHDLKTPITRLRLRVEMLEDGEIKAKLAQDLEEMEALVRTTLGFLRGLEAEERMQPLDVMALLESLQADARDAGSEVSISGRALEPYVGRPQALKRCVRNLIDNAIQYGESAAVAVEDSPVELRIRIRDRGPGIPERELERVFEPFYRVEGSRSRETGGTGLGLSIARSIAQLHGGTLALRNVEGGGLEATLILPRTAADTRRAPSRPEEPALPV
jgi:signal transduction histidine kinase